jgi:hypothetical protein
MSTNDFVPFAIGGGANVPSQASYLANPLLGSGNLPGVASSLLNNKALRQSTYMAAALAQYLANTTGNNVNDNGDATFAAILATMAQTFPTRTTAFTPAWTATTTAPTFGSLATSKGFQRRISDCLEIEVTYCKSLSGTSATDGVGTYLLTLPSGLVIDSTKIGVINGAGTLPTPSRIGTGCIGFASTGFSTLGVYANSTTTLIFGVDNDAGFSGTYLSSGYHPFQSGSATGSLSFSAKLPIVGW